MTHEKGLCDSAHVCDSYLSDLDPGFLIPPKFISQILIIVFLLIIILPSNLNNSYSQTNDSNILNIEANDVGIDYSDNKGYFVSADDKKVYVVDLATKEIREAIDTPGVNEGIEVNNITNRVYVEKNGGGMYVIDGQKDEIIHIANYSEGSDFAVNSLNNMMYVLGDRLVEIDLTTEKEIRSMPIEEGWHSIEINPFRNLIYIAGDTNEITIVNSSASLRNFTILGNATVANGPSDMVINPLINKEYIINGGLNRISVIDGDNNYAVKNIILNSSELWEEPAIEVDLRSKYVFVSNYKEAKILVVDDNTNKTVTTLFTESKASDIVVDHKNNYLYTLGLEGPVNFINISNESIQKAYSSKYKNQRPTIDLDDSPKQIVADPVRNYIYVMNWYSNKVTVIDGSKNIVIDELELNFEPVSMDFNTRTNNLFLVSNDTMHVIDRNDNNSMKNQSFGKPINNILIDSDNNLIYLHVVSWDGESQYKLDGSTFQLLGNYTGSSEFINANPFMAVYVSDNVTMITNTNQNISISEERLNLKSLEYNPVRDLVYLQTDDKLLIVDFNTNSVKTIDLSSQSTRDLLSNPISDKLYISDSSKNSILVLNGSNYNPINNISVGIGPEVMDFNPETNTIYVANGDSKDISVIDNTQDKLLVPSLVMKTNPPNGGLIKCENQNIQTSALLFQTKDLNLVIG
jgi:YVTN family beta-propeller protein